MPQTRKRDIADFFRANARPIVPRKRPTPDPDDDTIIFRERSTTGTPSATRFTNHGLARSSTCTPSKPSVSPLITPRSGRYVSVAYRSPKVANVYGNSPSKSAILFPGVDGSSQSATKTASFSFADTPSSSKKVVENGRVVAVRDSDESDNESLESLTDIFDRKTTHVHGSSAEQPTSSAGQEDERVRLLSMYTGGRSDPIVNRERMRAVQRQERENKYDLSSILDEDREEEATRLRILQMEAELEESTRQIQETKQRDIDKDLLSSILQGNTENTDPDELARLMSAVDRTEAISGDKTYSFFDQRGPRGLDTVKRSKRPFQTSATLGDLWPADDLLARNRMYVSGIMTDLANRGGLRDDVLDWTYESILDEADEELRDAYLSCVAAASSSWTRANITPENIQDAFVALGAEHAAVRDNTAIESRRCLRRTSNEGDNRSLLSALSVFCAICQDMDFPTLSKLVSLITRLSLDQHVMSHNPTMEAVESLLRKLADLPDLLSQQHVHERILFDLGSNLKEPPLQARFVSHFMPTSPSGTKFRITLAATFLLGSGRAAKILKPRPAKSPLMSLLKHIASSPVFRITPDTDYTNLAANIALLDATISSSYCPLLNTRADENDFNAQVDDLADKLHEVFTSIADAGASHMKKTEAKDLLQALHNRLLFAMRTRIRRKKHVFDTSQVPTGDRRIREAEETRQELGGKDFMQRFLKKQEVKDEGDDVFVDVLEL